METKSLPLLRVLLCTFVGFPDCLWIWLCHRMCFPMVLWLVLCRCASSSMALRTTGVVECGSPVPGLCSYSGFLIACGLNYAIGCVFRRFCDWFFAGVRRAQWHYELQVCLGRRSPFPGFRSFFKLSDLFELSLWRRMWLTRYCEWLFCGEHWGQWYCELQVFLEFGSGASVQCVRLFGLWLLWIKLTCRMCYSSYVNYCFQWMARQCDGNHRHLWNLEFSGATSVGISRTSDSDW